MMNTQLEQLIEAEEEYEMDLPIEADKQNSKKVHVDP